RRVEALGYSTLLVPDHVAPILSPLLPLLSAADVTTDLHVGTFVLNNDLRHPVLVARDAAVLDLLSDGRFELGIGAGHAAPEYAALGVPFDAAPIRVERLEEAAQVLRRLFDGETVSIEGSHYQVREQCLMPNRRPSLLIGG